MSGHEYHTARCAVASYLHRREHAAWVAVREMYPTDAEDGVRAGMAHPMVSEAASAVASWHAAEATGTWHEDLAVWAPPAWQYWADRLRSLTNGITVVDGARSAIGRMPAPEDTEATADRAEASAFVLALESVLLSADQL
ncbi:hypothetical protein SAMN05421803_1522 [Nocardiopsis flavescens]|uniref:Uncharacterized protein n=1 Tax=Nocardiopsis flavescens TaxID=758803 RepID=A0A1M6WV43_9ACTN|nr:hypothetical protein [Nocardiopsis flavescens]SHK97640.1 hypothetical protein SAMN05421803_1522 [Nocardiopsis flavescens]